MKSFASFFVCLAIVSMFVAGVPAQRAADKGPDFVPGEMLVQFKAGVDDSEISRVLGKVNGAAVEKVRAAERDNFVRGDLVLARFPNVVTPAAARREIEAEPTVEFAEPNWIYRHTATSNDTYYASGQLWGMYGAGTSPANQYGSNAALAWAGGHTNCGNVVVGVIDEGIYYNHVDLAANIWTNPFDAADGVDNDGNGYVDDVRGWDFDGGTNNINSGGSTDDHGTHVAGTIGAVGGNGAGVAGVCWSGIKMISAKFLGRRGGTTANAVKAVDYITDLKTRHGLNIVATNNSWGGGGSSQALIAAINRANAANILFIAAAGNNGVNNDSSPHYPSSYTNANIISVASITSSGALSSFSNYGAISVDIGAPGSGIISTVPAKSGSSVVSGYASYSGTSMATPHVTGAAALYASTRPGATAAQIKAAILDGTPTNSLNGKVATGDRLNAGGF